mgnify:CR=1 FL=1
MRKKIYINIIFGKNKKATGYILDITSAGIGIVSSRNIPASTLVKIIPKSSQLANLNGVIVYTIKLESLKRGYKSGLKFISPSKEQTNSLIKFINPFKKVF